MKLRILMIASLALSLGTAAADDVVAQRGNVTLTASQLKAALAQQSDAERAKLAADPSSLNNFVQNVLIGRVLLSQAEAAKWDQTPAVQAALVRDHDTIVVESYLANEAKLPANFPSEDQIKAAYQQNLTALMRPRRFQLQQVLIAVPAGASQAAVATARAQATKLRAQALAAKADLQTLAGGNTTGTGWITEDNLPAAVKGSVEGLPVGGVSQPLRTTGGWLVLKLVGTVPAGPLPLAQAHDLLAQALRNKAQQQAAQAYLDKLAKDQPIQLNAIAISAVAGGQK